MNIAVRSNLEYLNTKNDVNKAYLKAKLTGKHGFISVLSHVLFHTAVRIVCGLHNRCS